MAAAAPGLLAGPAVVPQPTDLSAVLAKEARALRIGERLARLRKAKGFTLARLSATTSICAPTSLARGDCMYFDSKMAHACVAAGDEPADILVVVAASGA